METRIDYLISLLLMMDEITPGEYEFITLAVKNYNPYGYRNIVNGLLTTDGRVRCKDGKLITEELEK